MDIHYVVIAIGAFFALFWDEMLIALISIVFNKSLSMKFILFWIVFSGLLVGLLILFHIPSEYHTDAINRIIRNLHANV